MNIFYVQIMDRRDGHC